MLSYAFMTDTGFSSSQKASQNEEQVISAVQAPEEKEKGGWSLFKTKDEPEDQRLALRYQALHELQDGASYFAACGDINAGFFGNCRFTFSEQVQTAYAPQVEAAEASFKITLVARGEQKKDGCTRFTAASDGSYLAYDTTGALNSRCFTGSGVAEQGAVFQKVAKDIDNKHDVPVLARSR